MSAEPNVSLPLHKRWVCECPTSACLWTVACSAFATHCLCLITACAAKHKTCDASQCAIWLCKCCSVARWSTTQSEAQANQFWLLVQPGRGRNIAQGRLVDYQYRSNLRNRSIAIGVAECRNYQYVDQAKPSNHVPHALSMHCKSVPADWSDDCALTLITMLWTRKEQILDT